LDALLAAHKQLTRSVEFTETQTFVGSYSFMVIRNAVNEHGAIQSLCYGLKLLLRNRPQQFKENKQDEEKKKSYARKSR